MLPALALMPRHPGRDDVFPFDTPRSDRILSGQEMTARKIDDGLDVGAATVKVFLHPGEDVRQYFLRVAEVPMSDGLIAIDELNGGACRWSRGQDSGFGGVGCRRKQRG